MIITGCSSSPDYCLEIVKDEVRTLRQAMCYMIKVTFIVPIMLFMASAGFTQDSVTDRPLQKRGFYVSAGWHRAWYTRSTIEFRNDTYNYNFRINKARGIDDNDLNIGKGIDAPQWSVRGGYFFRSGWGIEISYDHAKYILEQGQTVRMLGDIQRQYYNRDTTINPLFIKYEHTDGANYYMLSLLKKIPLEKDETGNRFDWLVKAGAGPVIPRTNSWIMGRHYDDKYHLSGYVIGLENSLRYEIIKNFFAEISLKTVFANYTDVLIHDEGSAHQKWGSGLLLFTISYGK